MPIPAAVAIPAAASLATNALNTGSSILTNRANRKHAEKMYRWQRQDSLADWAMQNEYNSPAAQMQRFKDAGLSPHLIYGQQSEAAPIRSSDAQSPTLRSPEYDLRGVGDAVMGYADIKLKQAQTDNTIKSNTILDEEKVLKQIAQAIGLTELAQKEFNLGVDKETRLETIETRKLAVEQIGASIAKSLAETKSNLDENDRRAALQGYTIAEKIEAVLKSRQERAKSRAEINQIQEQIENLKKDKEIKQLDIDLKKKGLQPGDALWQRKLTEITQGVDDLSTGEMRKQKDGSFKKRGLFNVLPAQ